MTINFQDEDMTTGENDEMAVAGDVSGDEEESMEEDNMGTDDSAEV